MASITIRRLPENTKRRLRIRAARNGRSMEQEARELLEAGLARTEPKSENLGEIIHRRFAALGGVDLKILRLIYNARSILEADNQYGTAAIMPTLPCWPPTSTRPR